MPELHVAIQLTKSDEFLVRYLFILFSRGPYEFYNMPIANFFNIIALLQSIIEFLLVQKYFCNVFLNE